MEQSMRRFMKVGIILHVSYPQLGGGEGPVLECLERICGDDYLSLIHISQRQAVKDALELCGYHRGRTAAYLGIDKSTLWRKMKKYGIEG